MAFNNTGKDCCDAGKKSTKLDGLCDVDTAVVADGDIIAWNAANAVWTNIPAPVSGIPSSESGNILTSGSDGSLFLDCESILDCTTDITDRLSVLENENPMLSVTEDLNGDFIATYRDGTTSVLDVPDVNGVISGSDVTFNIDGNTFGPFATGPHTVDTDTAATAVNNGDGTITVSYPNGVSATYDTGTHTVDTAATAVDNGDGTVTVSYPNGVSATYDTGTHTVDTAATAVDNGDGTVTVSYPNGVSATYDTGPHTVDTDTAATAVNNGDGTITVSYPNGVSATYATGPHTVDTAATAVVNGDGTITVSYPNGVSATYATGPHTVDTDTTYTFVTNGDGSVTITGSDATTFTTPASTIDTDTFATLAGSIITFANGSTLDTSALSDESTLAVTASAITHTSDTGTTVAVSEVSNQDMEDGTGDFTTGLITNRRLEHILNANGAVNGAGDPIGQTRLGINTLNSNTTAVNMLAVGYLALQNSDTAETIGIGSQAGQNVTSGANQVFVGVSAGRDAINLGSGLVAVGGDAARNLDGAVGAVAVGDSALSDALTARYSVGVGFHALTDANLQNKNSTAIGAFTGDEFVGQESVLVGAASARRASGNNLSFVGNNSGFYFNGNDSIALGQSAGLYATGDRNSTVGAIASTYMFGDDNTMIGYRAGNSANTGENTALGSMSFTSFVASPPFTVNITSGSSAVTFSAPHGVTVGDRLQLSIQTSLGNIATVPPTPYALVSTGATTAEFVNIFVTPNTTGAVTAVINETAITNSTAIGFNSQPTQSNQVVLGDSRTTQIFTTGDILANGFLTPSDPKLKVDIRKLGQIKDGQVQFVEYSYNKEEMILTDERKDVHVLYPAEYDKEGNIVTAAVTETVVTPATYMVSDKVLNQRHTGVLADDKNIPENCVTQGFKDFKQVDYVKLLIKITSDQQNTINDLIDRIEQLEQKIN